MNDLCEPTYHTDGRAAACCVSRVAMLSLPDAAPDVFGRLFDLDGPERQPVNDNRPAPPWGWEPHAA